MNCATEQVIGRCFSGAYRSACSDSSKFEMREAYVAA